MVSSLTAVKNRQLARVTVFVAIVLGCVAPQAASAFSPSWQLNSKPLKEAVSVTSKGTLKFSDKAGGLFGEKTKVECKITGKGSAGSGAADETTQWTATGCTQTEGVGCSKASITIPHLPWHTELIESGGRMLDTITASEKGVPGYEIVCEGKAEDECSGAVSTPVENVSGGVDTVFSKAETGELKCTRGGKEAGAIEGTMLIENPAGGTLTAADTAPEGWWLKGELLKKALTTTSSGSLEFIDYAGGPLGEYMAVKCKITGEEAVGPGVAGEVKHWTPSGCESKSGTCPEPRITARSLPWHSELAVVEGQVRYLVPSNYELTCRGEFEYSCSGTVSAYTGNLSEDVEAVFNDPSGKLEGCSRGGGGKLLGSEIIESKEGRLQVK